ncbi:MAG: DUF177 domain-containing protein [Bacteroidales bacterium]|nr:DUF177 domain-containing protein [Bacteroidales bacterium]
MKEIIIPLDDWAAGERNFRYTADSEFFQAFGNTEILDAAVGVEVRVVKQSSRRVEADLHLTGTITVACDRCLEPLALPVDEAESLSFRADVPEDADLSEEGTEVLPLTSTPGGLDLSQVVYDYVCLALPLQRVHPEGGCNPDTVRFLNQNGRKDEEAAPSSPFAALKGLFESK